VRAITYTEYGPPDVLQLTEVPKPVPRDDEVLIRVHAASVNPLDRYFVRGAPFFIRIMAGLLKPRETRLGVDVAGRVEAVGSGVTRFKPGDEVFGGCKGAFAEYVCASEGDLALKPATVTFEHAATVNIAGITALQGLRDKGHIQGGQKVLINGAAGGVGTFAVQIARWFGADVTGVCSTRNLDMVRSSGADQVMDYTQEDFTRSGQRYDLILDMIGNHSVSDCRRALTPEGSLVLVGGPLAGMLKAVALSRFVSQNLVMMVAKSTREGLTILGQLLEAGKVTPVIDRRYPLNEVPEAIRYLEEGHASGKVVITVGS
jgi:NADPH:quinone reductase-like Zn-dependent oxidoreductase